jgi:hypothetical protein
MFIAIFYTYILLIIIIYDRFILDFNCVSDMIHKSSLARCQADNNPERRRVWTIREGGCPHPALPYSRMGAFAQTNRRLRVENEERR